MDVRRRAGAFLVSPAGRLFLFKFDFSLLKVHKQLWITPGGGVQREESFAQGLSRELYEECGLRMTIEEPHHFYRRWPFVNTHGVELISDEQYYIVHVLDETISTEHMDKRERKMSGTGRWWSAEEIAAAVEEPFFCSDLARILTDINQGKVPKKPVEIV